MVSQGTDWWQIISVLLKNYQSGTENWSQSWSLTMLKLCVWITCLPLQVDEKTRASMYKLRQTWVKVIPNPKLYALDVRVKQIDPAWPVTAKPSDRGNIHVNPIFLVSQVIFFHYMQQLIRLAFMKSWTFSLGASFVDKIFVQNIFPREPFVFISF